MANGRLDYHRICKQIFNQAQVDPVIVFNERGIISFYFRNSHIASRKLKEIPQNLVGIYDCRATLKMISEDIL